MSQLYWRCFSFCLRKWTRVQHFFTIFRKVRQMWFHWNTVNAKAPFCLKNISSPQYVRLWSKKKKNGPAICSQRWIIFDKCSNRCDFFKSHELIMIVLTLAMRWWLQLYSISQLKFGEGSFHFICTVLRYSWYFKKESTVVRLWRYSRTHLGCCPLQVLLCWQVRCVVPTIA